MKGEYNMSFIKKYSHAFVSVIFVMIAESLGFNPVYAALIISAYWAGREVAQAEERYIHHHTPNRRRSEMPVMTAYYNPKAWTVKGFWWDMVVPFVLSMMLATLLYNI